MEPPSSKHPDAPDIEVWTKAIEKLRSRCNLPDECLSGLAVRVRHSSRHEPFRSLGDAFKEILRSNGAELSGPDDLEHALTSSLQRQELDTIDAYLMIGGTTGVSAEAMELSHEKSDGGIDFSERTIVTLPKINGEGFIRKRLAHRNVKLHLYEQSGIDNGTLCVRVVDDMICKRRQVEMLKSQRKPKIGIITALTVEFDTMVAQLNDVERDVTRRDGAFRDYSFGTIPARNTGHHQVVVVRAGVGTNVTATIVERLFSDFDLDEVIMVGIAGGIPRMVPRDEDVRLGDIIVSGRKGIVQYDMIKVRDSGDQPNHNPMPASRPWVMMAESLPNDSGFMSNYNSRLDAAQKDARYKRPPDRSDVLKDDADPPKVIKRRKDPRRTAHKSLAFVGLIGSANAVVKSEEERERIRQTHGVLAIEMESAGLAEAAISNDRPFFVVRGICDYANRAKNDAWHGYAAMAAAVFAASLIQSMPLSEKSAGR